MIAMIAANAFREMFRDRLWIVLVLFGFLLLAGNHVLTPIALGEGPRVTVDIGLSTLSLLGILLAVLVGASLVHQEIDRKTIHVVLARPVGRTVYLLGKWLGLTILLTGVGVLLGAALTGVAWHLRGPEVVLPMIQALLLTVLAFVVLSSLATLFSSLSSPILTSIYTATGYVLGWWARDIRAVAAHLDEPARTLLTLASFALPNLEIFNARYHVAHLEAVAWSQIGLAAAYAATYSASLLALAALAFHRREFK